MSKFKQATTPDQLEDGAGIYKIELAEKILYGCSDNIKKAVTTRLNKLRNKTGIFKNEHDGVQISYKTTDNMDTAVSEREQLITKAKNKPASAI